jgi:hypothetical protein
MKRIIRTLLCAGAAAVMFTACEEELPHNQKVQFDTPAKLNLNVDVNGDVELMAPKTKAYTITVQAKEIADDNLTFTIKVNPDKVQEYNTANGTDYEIVPAEAYSISTNTLYLPRYNRQSSTSTLTLKADGMPDDGKTRLLPITIEKIEGNAETVLEANDSTFYVKFARVTIAGIKFKEGDGTESKPYIIRESQDMLALANSLKSGATTHFKMEADVDMADLSEWAPVNAVAPYDKAVSFDGNGHKITNFHSNAANMPSFFGVLKGSVRNLTFERARIENGTSNDGAGVLAGQAINATITDVTAEVDMSVDGSDGTGTKVGGLVGSADGCIIKNVNMKTYVTATTTKGPNFVGGMVGMCEGAASTIENCHNEGDITGYFFVGGLVGVVVPENSKMSGCSAKGVITAGARYIGGLIGYANKGFEITDSHAEGSVNVVNPYCGGFMGASQGQMTAKRCWAAVDVTNTAQTQNAGFIGNPGVKSGNALVNDDSKYGNSLFEDCYATGNITVGNRMAGGFIGFIEGVSGITVRRCYASGDVIAKGTLGPIGGLIGGAVQGSGSNFKTDIKFTLEKSIAWNKKIDNTSEKEANGYSSGGIIGAVCPTSTTTDNLRRADMDFIATRTPVAAYNVSKFELTDQENSTPGSPLPCPVVNVCPYHGKAAAAGATCSQAAKTLGWPEDVWDLSGEMPKLK